MVGGPLAGTFRYPMAALPSVIEMLVYVPTGTSFRSTSACSPLYRAKSTVGVPLIRGTLFPLAFTAFTLCTCTANETTLAIGASVPTTNAGAVSVTGVVVVVVFWFDPLLQPAAAKPAAISKINALVENLRCVMVSIIGHTFLMLSHFRGCVTHAM
jgi:hypothetical protein